MIASVRNIYRLFQIARTLAHHDALFPLEAAGIADGMVMAMRLLARRKAEGRPGERLARAIQKLGPSFIKLGQALSTRSDVLGEDVAADLSELQDHLPPFKTSKAIATIEQELEGRLEDFFLTFEDTPIAAASIAQVHSAITSQGDEVAVKVLRPGIELAFQKDLELLLWVANLIERTQPELRRLKPLKIIQAFQETVHLEMDLRLEAAAANEMEQNFIGDTSYQVPSVDWRRTSRRVLTSQRIQGIPIDERKVLIDRGFDPKDILANAATAFFKQVFRDGFFHADQHPGNIFVGKEGEIIAVDFGIMGRLDKPTRRYLGEMLLSFLTRDYRRVAEIHFEAGYVPAHKSVHAFTQACRSIAEPILDKPQNEISIARLLAQLFQVTKTFEMETQPQLLLLQKTMLIAEGVGRKLSPEINLWLLAHPLIQDWVSNNLGPEKLIMETVEEITDAIRKLPRVVSDMEKNAAALAQGGLKLHPDTIHQMGYTTNNVPRHTWLRYYLFLIAILIALLILV